MSVYCPGPQWMGQDRVTKTATSDGNMTDGLATASASFAGFGLLATAWQLRQGSADTDGSAS